MLMVQPIQASAPGTSADRTLEWHWVHSRDGQTAASHGRDVTALLPRDDDVVLVLPVLSVSWHHVRLPKINAARLRQALDGLLEDRLLADPAQLHLALETGLAGGQAGWVAACAREPLTHWLAALQAAERPASRIVPELAPQPQAALQALVCADQPWLVHTGPRGLLAAPLSAAPATGGATPAHASDPPARRLAEPGCAADAEAQVGQPFELQTVADRLLASSQTPWNLAQFDLRLSASARRGQKWAQALRTVAHAPAWRAARWGTVVLVAAGLLGLNGMAWQERQAMAAKQNAIRQLLTDTFPTVTLVLDAPLQMQREVARLQRAAGEVSPGDLEPFLASFSAIAPDSIGLSAIQYASNDIQLTLAVSGPDADAQVQTLRDGLQRQGWRTQYAAPVLTVRPIPNGARP